MGAEEMQLEEKKLLEKSRCKAAQLGVRAKQEQLQF
jgi:hypothetical protein